MQYPFMRVASGLSPASDLALDAVRRIKEGDTVRVEIATMRSPDQLRKWWARMDRAFDTLPDGTQKHYGDRKGLHAAVLCHLGYCIEIRRKQGDTETIIQRPQSIALGNMAPERFTELFDKAGLLLAETLGCTVEELDEMDSLPASIERGADLMAGG